MKKLRLGVPVCAIAAIAVAGCVRQRELGRRRWSSMPRPTRRRTRKPTAKVDAAADTVDAKPDTAADAGSDAEVDATDDAPSDAGIDVVVIDSGNRLRRDVRDETRLRLRLDRRLRNMRQPRGLHVRPRQLRDPLRVPCRHVHLLQETSTTLGLRASPDARLLDAELRLHRIGLWHSVLRFAINPILCVRLGDAAENRRRGWLHARQSRRMRRRLARGRRRRACRRCRGRVVDVEVAASRHCRTSMSGRPRRRMRRRRLPARASPSACVMPSGTSACAIC